MELRLSNPLMDLKENLKELDQGNQDLACSCSLLFDDLTCFRPRVGIRGIDLPQTNGTNSSNHSFNETVDHSSNETVETIETVAVESSLAGTGVVRCLGMPKAYE